jgi:hypothetical protein
MARGTAAAPAAPVVEETPALVAPTRAALMALVAEINTVLNLEPAMAFGRKATDEEIIAKIHEECDGNLYDQDFTPDPDDATIPVFTEVADKTFEALGIEILEGAPPADAAPAPAPTPAKGAAKPAKAAATPAAAKPAKVAKPAGEKKYTRDMAVIESINQLCKKGANFKTIMDTTDGIYVKHGGNSVPDAVNVNKYTLNGLVAFDVLVLDANGIYKFK